MPLAELEGDRIVVRTDYRDRDLIRAVPGAKYDAKESHAWTLPCTWSACLTLRGFFRERLEVGPLLAKWALNHYEEFVQPAMELRDVLDAEGEDFLYGFQRAGVQFLTHARRALLTDDMGTGKTVQTIRTMRRLTYAGEDVFPAIVVCPNNVKGTWIKEFERWWPDVGVEALDGGRVGRLKQIERVAQNDAQVLVANWEALRMHSRLAPYGSIRLKRCWVCDKSLRDVYVAARATMQDAQTLYDSEPESEELAAVLAAAQAEFKKVDRSYGQQNCERCSRELNEIPWASIVGDEIHRAKDPKAKQTRALWALRTNDTLFRYGLTGTPIADTPQDLWPALHFIDPEQWPSRSQYIDRWCLTVYNPFGGMDVVGLKPETREEFFRITDPHVRRMPKKLVLSQLPDKTYSTRYVDMAPKQKKAYDSMREDMLAQIGSAAGDEQRLIAVNPLTQLTRLIQFSSAYAELDAEGNVHLTDPSCKLDALMEILEEAQGRPLVVFAQSRQLIELAAVKLDKNKITYGKIVGGQHVADRQRQIDNFQNGHYTAMLVTVQAGGEGITLTRADTAVFLQRSWSMIQNNQAEDRIHRIGAEVHDAIHIIDVISRGTIEEGQRLALSAKEERMEEVVRDEAAIKRLVIQGVI
jgi:SNF2 family DNA or RNA helicase